jgi:hypothetical protein
MSTSGTYSFTVNRDQIIRDAMLNIGKLDEIEAPTPQETTDCAFKLNMMIKQWQGKADFAPGLKVWTRRRGHLFLNGAGYQYTLGPNGQGWTQNYVYPVTTSTAVTGATQVVLASVAGISVNDNIGVELDAGTLFWTTVSAINTGTLTVTLAAALPSQASTGAQVFDYTTTATQPIVVETATLRDQQLNDTPLKIMTVQDYDLLPSKVAPQNIGDPGAIYYEFQLGNSNLFTDVAAADDVTKHIVLTYLEAVQDMNSASDNFEYPQEWYLALSLGLSKLICPMFNAQWSSLLEENFKTALAIAQRKDPEIITLFFQPGAED